MQPWSKSYLWANDLVVLTLESWPNWEVWRSLIHQNERIITRYKNVCELVHVNLSTDNARQMKHWLKLLKFLCATGKFSNLTKIFNQINKPDLFPSDGFFSYPITITLIRLSTSFIVQLDFYSGSLLRLVTRFLISHWKVINILWW